MTEIPVFENYGSYQPKFRAASTVKKLVRYVPEEFLRGLGTIHLTSVAALNRQDRRRRTRGNYRVGRDAISGFYSAKHGRDAAFITIFLDRISEGVPNWVWKVSLLREVLTADVLYHELGHHIHATARPEYREKEDVAEYWRKRLSRLFFRRRYWYLVPIVVPLSPLVRLVLWFRRRHPSRRT